MTTLFHAYQNIALLVLQEQNALKKSPQLRYITPTNSGHQAWTCQSGAGLVFI